jgi:hypothetical protein
MKNEQEIHCRRKNWSQNSHIWFKKKKRQTYRFRKPNRPQHIVIKVLKKKDTKQEVKEIKTLFSENQQHN